jgi:predicted enzyme related to lactoylglutathione lyase
MKTKALDFVVYSVPDMKKAFAFYRDTLGIDFPLVEEGKTWTEFDSPPLALALHQPREGSFSWPGTPAVGLAVDDVYAAVEELRAKGVKIVSEPVETSVCHMAFIEDPFGNRLCLHQRKDGTVG